ncbi:MAG TPA: HIT family protein [Chitinophagales bacterium]
MPSIFTRIINGEIPCYKIYEDENFFSFLDVAPLQKGHVLVVPKQEVDYIFNLDEKTYSAFFTTAKKIAHAIEKAVPCKRIGIAVVGLEVPHAHIHLIPLSTTAINFSDPKLSLAKEEMEEIAIAIRTKF